MSLFLSSSCKALGLKSFFFFLSLKCTPFWVDFCIWYTMCVIWLCYKFISSISTLFIEETILALLCALATLVKDQSITDVPIFGLSILFISTSILCQHCTVLITNTLQYSLKSEKTLLFRLQIAFTVSGLLWFHVTFSCFISVKNGNEIMTVIALSL